MPLIDEYNEAQERLDDLARGAADDHWWRRAHPARWSIGECIEQLILTTEAFLPLIDAALASAPRRRVANPRLDFTGWIIWWTSGPSRAMKVKTTAPFVPAERHSKNDQLTHFARRQQELVERVAAAEEVDATAVKIASPFSAKIRYSLWSALRIIPRHQLRHIAQAEEVLAQLR